MAARVRYNWGAIMSSRAARRAKSWIAHAQEGAPSPQAPFAREEVEGMIAACRTRLAKNPRNIYTMMSLGYHLIYIGEHRKAILLLDRAIELDPDNWLLHERRGTALLELGMYDDALEAFVRARSCSPGSTDPFSIGITLGLLGRKAEASRALGDAMPRDRKATLRGLSYMVARRALVIHG